MKVLVSCHRRHSTIVQMHFPAPLCPREVRNASEVVCATSGCVSSFVPFLFFWFRQHEWIILIWHGWRIGGSRHPCHYPLLLPPSWFCMFEFQVLIEHMSKKKQKTSVCGSHDRKCPILLTACCVEERKVWMEANANVRIHFQRLVCKIQVKLKGTPACRFSRNNDNCCIRLCHDETASV